MKQRFTGKALALILTGAMVFSDAQVLEVLAAEKDAVFDNTTSEDYSDSSLVVYEEQDLKDDPVIMDESSETVYSDINSDESRDYDSVKPEMTGDVATGDWYSDYYDYTLDKSSKKLLINKSKGQFVTNKETSVVVPAKTLIEGETYTTVLNNAVGENSYGLWVSDYSAITSITLEDGVALGADASYLFYFLKNLTELNLGTLNTSETTNMSAMFDSCESLTSINVGSFDTANVRDMSRMFRGCKSLETLDLSAFNTGNVTSMSAMFGNCEALKEIDLTGFNTSKVTDMTEMFSNCKSLMALDLSGFDTSKVTYMISMFKNLSPHIQILDLSSFNMSNVKRDTYASENMFDGAGFVILCLPVNSRSEMSFSGYGGSTTPNLAHIYYAGSESQWSVLKDYIDDNIEVHYNSGNPMVYKVPTAEGAVTEKWYDNYYYWIDKVHQRLVLTGSKGGYADQGKTEETIYKTTMIDGVPYITVLDNSGNTSSFWAYKDLSVITKLTIQPGVELTPNSRYLFYFLKNLTSLTVSGIDTSNVIFMDCFFMECEKLESLDLDSFDTSSVVDMSNMFARCESLKELDLSHFQTSNVTEMNSMFEHCLSLREADLGSFDTSKVNTMSSMFRECTGLMTLDLSNFNTSNVTTMYEMFYALSPHVQVLDLRSFDFSHVLSSNSSNEDVFASSGIVDLYLPANAIRRYGFSKDSYKSEKDEKYLSHIYYAGSKDKWDTLGNSADESIDIFYDFKGDISVRIETDPEGAASDLSWCDNYNYWLDKKNKRLVLTGSKGKYKNILKTNETIKAKTRIGDDIYITVLDNAGNDNSFWTYDDCTVIKKLTVEPGVELTPNSSYLFYYLKELDTLNIRGIKTDNVVFMTDIFGYLPNLCALDLTGFNTSSVKYMDYMFSDCSRIKTLDCGNFDTSNVLKMNGMFRACSALESVNVSSFDTSNVTGMDSMFYGCASLKILDISNFNTSKLKYTSDMFRNAGVSVLDLRNMDLTGVTGSYSSDRMFGGSSVTKIYFPLIAVKNYSFGRDLTYGSADVGHKCLTDIYYPGDEDQWGLLSNYVPEAVTIHYNYDGSDEVLKTEFTVNFNANGGYATESSKVVTYNSAYGELPEASRTGYTFDGWWTERTEGTKVTDSSVVSVRGNHSLYAHWIKDTVSVTGITLDKDTASLKKGETLTLKATIKPSDATNKNVTWTSDKEGVATVTDGIITAVSAGTAKITVMTEDGGLTADCVLTVVEPADVTVKVTVSYDVNGGDVLPANTKEVTVGDPYGELPNPTRKGYSFSGWYTAAVGGTPVTATTSVTAEADHVIYAHWTQNEAPAEPVEEQHTVTFYLEDDLLSVADVARGAIVDADEIPDAVGEGEFVGWFHDNENGVRWDPTMPVYGNLILCARFVRTEEIAEEENTHSGLDPALIIGTEDYVYMVKGQSYNLPQKTDNGAKITWTSVNSAIKIASNYKAKAVQKTNGTPIELSNNVNEDKYYAYVADPVISLVKIDGKGNRTLDAAGKLSLVIGDTAELALDGLNVTNEADSDGEDYYDLVWTSSNAEVVKVDNGNIIALSKGSAKVSAYVNGKAFTSSITVKDINTVGGKDVSAVKLKPLQTVTLSYSDGFKIKNSNIDLGAGMVSKPAKNGVEFYQNNVVRITPAGKVTAVGSGDTTITFQSGSIVKTVDIHVDKPVQSIVYLNTGKSKAIKYYNVKASDKAAAWSVDSGKEAVIKAVKTKGKYTATGIGSDVIRCTYDPYQYEGTQTGFEYSTMVYVEDPELDTLDGKITVKNKISGSTTMDVGENMVVKVKNVSQPVTFTSNKPAVAFIDEAGVVRARGTGKAVLTTRINGKKITLNIQVK